MNRRYALWGTGALCAGIAWRWHTDVRIYTQASQTLWATRFQSPHGEPLAMSAFEHGQGPLLINFWATWCPPCVEELPALEVFYQHHRHVGWQVLGLAVDDPVAVQTFMTQHPVTYPIAMAGSAGIDLSRQLGNTSGALPFTIVYNRDRQITFNQAGRLDEEALQKLALLKAPL